MGKTKVGKFLKNTTGSYMDIYENVPIIGGAISSARDKKRERENRKKAGDRPTYIAPKEYGENVNTAQRMFDSNYGKLEAEAGINNQGAQARKDLSRNANSFSDLLKGSSSVADQMIQAQLGSDIQFANQRFELGQNLQRTKEVLAGSKEDEFEYNQAGRYAEFMGRADAFNKRSFETKAETRQQLFDVGTTAATGGFGAGKTVGGK